MKHVFLFLMLVSGMTGYSQSDKKLNQKLHAALTAEQQKQDSLHQAFKKSQTRLDQLKAGFPEKIRQLSEKVLLLDPVTQRFFGTFQKLIYLEQKPDMGYFEKFRSLQMPEYFDSVLSAVNNQMKSFDAFQMENNPNAGELSKKEENEILKVQIQKYTASNGANQQLVEDREKVREQLELLDRELDLNLVLYDDLYQAASDKANEMEHELEVLKQKYSTGKPENFPDMYFEIFPDVHPEYREKKRKAELINETAAYSKAEVSSPPAHNHHETDQAPTVYDVVDESAEFPGGMPALKKYLDEHLQYPAKAKELGVSNKVYLRFVVSDKGKISDIEIKKGIPDCPECDKEALRVVKTMPNFTPGKVNGKQVSSYFQLPVSFRLN